MARRTLAGGTSDWRNLLRSGVWLVLCVGAVSSCGEDADDPPKDTGCCGGQALHIRVVGTTVDLQMAPHRAGVAPVAPLHALYSDNPRKLTKTTSVDGTGAFETDCFDVADISLGLVLLTDDEGFDETGGDFYPTGTGVLAWDTDEEKVCVDDAQAFVVPTSTIALLDALPDIDMATDGIAMGLVLDVDGQPVAGAQIKHADGQELPKVYYPNAALDDFSGTATSATGLYVVPGPLPDDPDPIPIAPFKTGLTWKPEGFKAGSQKNLCYFLRMQAISQ